MWQKFQKYNFQTHHQTNYQNSWFEHSLWNCSHVNATDTSLRERRNFIGQWLGATRQPTITWTNLDPYMPTMMTQFISVTHTCVPIPERFPVVWLIWFNVCNRYLIFDFPRSLILLILIFQNAHKYSAFVQLFVPVNIKENIKAPYHWPFVWRINRQQMPDSNVGWPNDGPKSVLSPDVGPTLAQPTLLFGIVCPTKV